jgi:large subunit ribosomal protein L13
MSQNNDNSNRDWYLIDAKGIALGRTATSVANLLRGKNKVNFMPNMDQGDFVVVINADKFVLTGKKEEQKRYYKVTGYLGNMKTTTVPEMMKSKPGEIMKIAVLGMLPKNKLQDKFIGRLKVYSSDEHPHQNIKFKTL